MNRKKSNAVSAFGSCCDFRRTAIIIAVVGLISSIVSLFSDSTEDKYNTTATIIVLVILILMEILLFAGAIRYNKWMVSYDADIV